MKKKKKILIAIIPIGVMLLLTMVCFTGCFESDTDNSQNKQLSSELNVFNWDDYFGETTLEDFEKQYGVKINLYTFEDESLMFSSLESNPTKYDVVIASGSFIAELIKTKSLAELDKNNIPNLDDIDTGFLDLHYDPGNIYSIPYVWGTTGIAYNTSALSYEVTSWDVLWDSNYSGNISMLNSKDEVIAAACKKLGYSINTDNASELSEVENLLLEQKPLLDAYADPFTIQEELISGEILIGHLYSGDGFVAADRNEDVTYVIPDEGAPIWIDNMFIPVDSPHKYTAEVFINYILDPMVSANITNYLWYANPNTAAEEFIDSEILEDPGVYPSQEVLDKCEFFSEKAALINSEYNRIWSLLQAE